MYISNTKTGEAVEYELFCVDKVLFFFAVHVSL